MELKALKKNKAGSNAVTTDSDTKSNIPRGFYFAITLLHSTDSFNKRELVGACRRQSGHDVTSQLPRVILV
jgi:hypothetical protein